MTRQAVSDHAAEQNNEEIDPDVAAIRAMLRDVDLSTQEKAADAAPLIAPPSASPSDSQIDTQVKTALQDALTEATQAADDAPADAAALARAAHENAENDLPPRQPPQRTKRPTARIGGGLIARLVRETSKTLALLGRFVWQVMRHPRTPRVLAALVIALVVVARPLFALSLVLLSLLVGAITYFSLGPDTVDRLIFRWFERMKERDPTKAERLRGRAVRVISVLNRVIDRLPDRWTSGLYLPDLEPPQDPPEKMQNDPFERLEPAPGAQPVVRKAHPVTPPVLDDPRARTPRPVNPSDPSTRRRPPRQLRP